MNPHTYGHLIFNKGGKTIPKKNDSIFSTNGASSIGGLHVEESKLIQNYLLAQSSTPSVSRLPHEAICTETNKRKSGKIFEHMCISVLPEQNTNGLCSEIKN